MRIKNRNFNWILDAVLFAAFLGCFWMDLTGVGAHQWLGVGLALLSSYHLLVHFNWVKGVTRGFFSRARGAARLNYLVDLALLAGLGVITVTGLQISTWLALPYESIGFERHLHIQTAVLTMLVLVLKIGLHWRWVLQTPFSRAGSRPIGPTTLRPQPMAAQAYHSGRRDFLKLMGAAGGAALLSVVGVLDALGEDQPLPNPQVVTTQSIQAGAEIKTAAVSSPAAVQKGQSSLRSYREKGVQAESNPAEALSTPFPVSVSPAVESAAINPPTSCVVRCERGCSYPGGCRRYQDQNGNGRCDFGECA